LTKQNFIAIDTVFGIHAAGIKTASREQNFNLFPPWRSAMSLFTGIRFKINRALPREPGYRRLSNGVIEIRPDTLAAVQLAGQMVEDVLEGRLRPEDLVARLGRRLKAQREERRFHLWRETGEGEGAESQQVLSNPVPLHRALH
jgi:hypothetical protein